VEFRRALIAAVALAACLVTAAELPASAIQQRIKAAFLSKFPAYVEWPAGAFSQPESPLVIGVAGAEAIARELDQAIAGRTVAGRTLRVHRIAAGEQPDDCCQILFVGADSGHERTTQLLAQARGRPVLTVTELDDQPQGSIINFLVADDRVRFDISRPAAERNGLQVRAQLLAVARQATTR
jgi:hypothetical protein